MRRIRAQVDGRRPLRAVEIDDVQPPRAELAILHRELDGVDGVARLLREIALQQPHAAPVAEVDGRYQLHIEQLVTDYLQKVVEDLRSRRATSAPGETACRRSCPAR